ncbi:MAG: EAL domain-containing protein [Candidatus Sedimenticola sp. (ex Thyasira tokunagai)]
MEQEAKRVSPIPSWLGYGLLYFLTHLLGVQFASFFNQPPPLSIAAGVALAALLSHGYKLLPSIAVGAGASLFFSGTSWEITIGLTFSILLEAVLAYWMIERSTTISKLFALSRNTAVFLLFGVVAAPLAGAAGITSTFWLSGLIDNELVGNQLISFWLSDACGVLLIVPLIIAWRKRSTGTNHRQLELFLLLLSTVLVSLITFGLLNEGRYPLAHLPLPILVWVLFRFGLRTLSLILLLVSAFAIAATIQQLGPFVTGGDRAVSFLLLQLYITIAGASALMVKALLHEHSIALKQLALTAKVIDYTPDAIVVTNRRGQVLTVNPAFRKNTGFSSREIVGKSLSLLESGHHDSSFFTSMWQRLTREGEWSGEIWNRSKSGTTLPEWLHITAMRNKAGEITHYIGIYSSIAHQQQVMDRIHKLAYYDILTHLPNRQLFTDRLLQALKYAGRNKQTLALIFLDLDRFKNVNDTLGHGIGDKVLTEASRRLLGCVRQADTLARLGGDEFTIILQNINEKFDAVVVADKILEAFRKPFQIGEHELFITTSIGIALYPKDGHNSEELIKYADTAMYRAKGLSGNTYQLFASGMSETYEWNLEMETALRRAIETGAIQMLYQPQFDLQNGAIIGVEALARWHDPSLGDISPEVFIQVAENTGLIHRLGEQTLKIAIRQAGRWGEAGVKGLRVSINVSTLQLRQRDFLERVEAITSLSRNSGNRLELEVTETSVMENAEFMEETLRSISSLGLELAVDDFGTGYSSLSYLKRLPIDRLKIDQSFVRDLPDNSNDTAICRAIIAMAHSLNLRVIAEGVETEQQRAFLQRENCDEMQGFLISKPVSADEITEMVHQGYWQIG